ncbi:MAG: carbon dioxide-concentrating mechanism protein CcmK [Oculatellaceae cyanobacterium bins.114]|nr:carbon dioxide-concentrating mechanism protein CcmK [Oculatellaceae cyanobacterium bins.114]
MAEIVQQQGFSKLSNQAIGLLETRGFPAMVGAADAMLKAADVNLAAYEMTGDGLCTAIIRGRVSDVAIAIEVGMHEAERIGELHAIIIIPRPLDDLELSLPVASHWLEQLTPLQLPLEIKETQKELVAQEEPQQAAKADLVELPDLRDIQKSPLENAE